MQVKSVKRYAGASYPNRQAAERDPKLLASVPQRWRSKPVVLAALSSLMGIAAASQTHVAGPHRQARVGSLVAPVFIHGEGRGTFGCVAINPPVFLSEAEARAVVTEEAKRAGIHFKTGGPAIPGVLMPAPTRAKPDRTAKLRPDGFDAKLGIEYIVVSESDTERWTAPSGSTVEHYDAKQLASSVAAKVRKSAPKAVVATFYEPFERPTHLRNGSWEEERAQALVQERRELRKQVRDFIAWLKTQGVI